MSFYNSSSPTKNIEQLNHDLVQWTLHTLVNRSDTYGQYIEGEPKRRKTYLDLPRDLRAHYHGRKTIGLYALDQQNQGLWVWLDWDSHDPANPTDNFPDAFDVYLAVQELGLNCYLENSNGFGGYHLCIPFTDKIDGYKLVALAKHLLRNQPHAEHKPLTPTNPNVGFFARLPGRHHKHKNHVSELWDGSKWVGLSHLLTVEPNDFSKVNHLVADAKPAQKRIDLLATYGHQRLKPANYHLRWEEILHGFFYCLTTRADGVSEWAREGVKHISATTNLNDLDLLHVFTNNATPFEKSRWYSKKGAHELLNGLAEQRALDLTNDN